MRKLKEEGSCSTDKTEYLGLAIRNQTKKLGKRKKKEGRRKQSGQMNSGRYTAERYQQTFADGCGARKRMGSQSPWCGTHPKGTQLARAGGLFVEIYDLEIEHELACAAACFWAQTVWTRQGEEFMREARTRKVWEAFSWKKVRGPAGAIFCEMIDFGLTPRSWQLLMSEDGRIIDVKNTCPEDVKNMSQARQ